MRNRENLISFRDETLSWDEESAGRGFSETKNMKNLEKTIWKLSRVI